MVRPAGRENNRTIVLRQRFEAAQAEAKSGDRLLAIRVLHDLMLTTRSLAIKYQPLDLKEGEKPPDGCHPDEAKFKDWAILTKDICAALAPFESPKLTAMAVDVSTTTKSEDAGAVDELIQAVDAIAAAKEFERKNKIIDVEPNRSPPEAKPEPETDNDVPTLVEVRR